MFPDADSSPWRQQPLLLDYPAHPDSDSDFVDYNGSVNFAHDNVVSPTLVFQEGAATAVVGLYEEIAVCPPLKLDDAGGIGVNTDYLRNTVTEAVALGAARVLSTSEWVEFATSPEIMPTMIYLRLRMPDPRLAWMAGL